MIKEFARKHMKSEEIKIDEELNRLIWQRGIRFPPRRVAVKMEKDEDGVVTVSLIGKAEREAKAEKAEEVSAVEAAPSKQVEEVSISEPPAETTQPPEEAGEERRQPAEA